MNVVISITPETQDDDVDDEASDPCVSFPVMKDLVTCEAYDQSDYGRNNDSNGEREAVIDCSECLSRDDRSSDGVGDLC